MNLLTLPYLNLHLHPLCKKEITEYKECQEIRRNRWLGKCAPQREVLVNCLQMEHYQKIHSPKQVMTRILFRKIRDDLDSMDQEDATASD